MNRATLNRKWRRLAALSVLVGFAAPSAWGQPAEQPEVSPAVAAQDDSGRIMAAQFEVDAQELLQQVPDPVQARAQLQREQQQAREAGDQAQVTFCRRTLELIDETKRAQQVHLSLELALAKTLAHSYALETQSFNPAIESTRVVEAESAFDAVFFGQATKNKTDQPVASQLAASQNDVFGSKVGMRKRLPLGTQVSAYHQLGRSFTDFQYQTLNPAYTSDAVFELTQPLLRGFGLDVNLAQVTVAKHNRQISNLAFHREVRDLVRNVEEAYWRLVQARRDVVTTARVLADFEAIYSQLNARKEFDVTEVQLAATKARLERSKAAYVQVTANVRNAEDQLIALINDPELNLADDVEIVPDDFPVAHPFVLDRMAEIQTALGRRPEIEEQRLRLASAEVAAGQAKNAQLPVVNLTFQYTSNGLGANADLAFDQMTGHNFLDYYVGVDVEVPIGNRGPRAAYRRAELQHSQAASGLKQQLEAVILDVNVALRKLVTSYEQIGPVFESAEANKEEVRSIVARAERKDINTLTTELNARESLASTRRTLVEVMVQARLALIDLERAKGTLLEFNNIEIAAEED